MDRERRRLFIQLVSCLFTASILIVYVKDSTLIYSLAGLRLNDESAPTFSNSIGDSSTSIFDSSNDPDDPVPDTHSSLKSMGEDDIQRALSGLVVQDTPKIIREPSAKLNDIFDPSKDPDAPRPKLSNFKLEELAESRSANKMKAQLKIEAQLAMLSEREKIRHNSVIKKTNDSKQTKLSNTPKKAEAVRKPSLESISEEVRKSLDAGRDPTSIIAKELALEKKFKSQERVSGTASIAEQVASAAEIDAHP